MVNNGYASIEELQAHIDASGDASFTAADDENMELAIEAASRWIDAYTGSRFYAATETRYYTADWYDLLYVDDLNALTTLKTDEDGDGVYETTWSATDYILEPRNGPALGIPYRQIRINREGRYSFSRLPHAIEVTGSFGQTAAPPVVKQACLLLAHRLWRRKDAIFGVAGTPGLGVTVVQAKIIQDADITALLDSLGRRLI
jgi:hypothetical protein